MTKRILAVLPCLVLAAGSARCQPVVTGNLAVNTINGSTIGISFDQPVSGPSAGNASNYFVYSLGGTSLTTVTNAKPQMDGHSVALSLSAPVGQFFAVAASNVLNGTATDLIDATATAATSLYGSTNIGTASDPSTPGTVFTAFRDTFIVTASGSGIGGTGSASLADHCEFVFQQVAGDFDMSVQVTNLLAANPNAMAGLMARNSLDPGSGMALLNFTPVQGSDLIQTFGRGASNSPATPFSSLAGASSYSWLRINRTGQTLTAFYGTNGLNWNVISNALPLVLNSNLFVGMAITSATNGMNANATFFGFGVSGARPGDGMMPMVKATLYQTTNVVVSWPITPRDFTVLVATNLIYQAASGTGGISSSNATQWQLLSLPIDDSTLTGTNAAMPYLGRYMIIPLNLFSNNQMFIRLQQVEQVIPDPLNLTPGIVLSQASGNLTSGASGTTICNLTVDSATAVAQSSVPVLCPSGHVYQFTTAPSGSGLETAIIVHEYPFIGTSFCDGSFSAGNYKSQVTVTNATGSGISGYTFVAAATTAVNTNSPIEVQINVIR